MDVESFFDTSCIKEKNIPFDAGFDAEEGLSCYLDLLNQYNIRSTLFLTVDTAERWKALLNKAVANGHELAVHSLDHEDITDHSDARFLYEVSKAKEIIEDIYCRKVYGYRAPCFGICQRKTEKLMEAGYKYDSSALNFRNASRSDYLDLENYTKISEVVYEKDGFFEFKPCVSDSLIGKVPICGGGYLRLVPKSVMKPAVSKYVKKADSYLFYVHPFELYQGYLPKYAELSAAEKMFVTRGRRNYGRKIRNIIELLIRNGYIFASMNEYLQGLSCARQR